MNLNWKRIQKTTNKVVKLTDKKNELLNILEASDDGLVHLSPGKESRIQNKISRIYRKLEKLEK